MSFSPQIIGLTAIVVGILIAATGIGLVLKRRVVGLSTQATISNLNTRIRAWWVMCLVFIVSLGTGGTATVLLFAVISFLALREYFSQAPTRHSDYASLVCAFYIVTPLQYALIGTENAWYFYCFLPLYALFFVPLLATMTGEYENLLLRCSAIQWGLVICVYGLSYVPALLALNLPGHDGQNSIMVFLLVLIVEVSDVFQYVWGKLLGKNSLAPRISPNKTREGALGGVVSATVIGTCVWWATPFSAVETAALALVTTVAGVGGGLVLSAVKRDRGMKDFGDLVAGHGGILDRVDSLCFAAPVFYCLSWYFLK